MTSYIELFTVLKHWLTNLHFMEYGMEYGMEYAYIMVNGIMVSDNFRVRLVCEDVRYRTPCM